MNAISIQRTISYELLEFIEKACDASKKQQNANIGRYVLYGATCCGAAFNMIIASVEAVASSALAAIAATAFIATQEKHICLKNLSITCLTYALTSLSTMSNTIDALNLSLPQKNSEDLHCKSIDLLEQAVKAKSFIESFCKNKIQDPISSDIIKNSIKQSLKLENNPSLSQFPEILEYRLKQVDSCIDQISDLSSIDALRDLAQEIQKINNLELPEDLRCKTVAQSFYEFIFNGYGDRNLDVLTSDIVRRCLNDIPEFFYINEDVDPITGRPLINTSINLSDKKDIGRDQISSLHPSSLMAVANLAQLKRSLMGEQEDERMSNINSKIASLSSFDKKLLLTKILPQSDVDSFIGKFEESRSQRIIHLQNQIGELASSLIQPANQDFNNGFMVGIDG